MDKGRIGGGAGTSGICVCRMGVMMKQEVQVGYGKLYEGICVRDKVSMSVRCLECRKKDM